MMGYSIWIVQYAYIPDQPVGSILLGCHNGGTRMFPMTYLAVKGEGHNILVDVGVGHSNPISLALQKRDHIENWHSPKEQLARIGMSPEKVDTIFITHAHFDHMDNLEAFPNATVYLQRKEFYGSLEALKLDRKYQGINKALNEENLLIASRLLEEGRLILLDGEAKEKLPGISLYPEYDSHSFASQIITIKGGDGISYVVTGDLVYSRDNYIASGNGLYIPIGLSVGGQMNLMKSMDHLLELAEGDMNRMIIAHDSLNWTQFPSKLCKNGLHLAEVCLAKNELSKL